ncbi:MAG TPA: glycerol-3-phosphate 1-O-acyltransferase PlsY [Dehalococcoidales bacterium]|nr:glycerol-3-phosphate 1-O-acyltransferase PlsY [Dehalococcoidales bacterium]
MLYFNFLAVIMIGYVLGSIPFGLIVSRYLANKDLRQFGSGKIGATNVLRTAGKKAAALSVICDVLKGFIPVMLAGYIFGDELLVVGSVGIGADLAQVFAGLAAIAGHNWSVFLKFKGGRGVATFFGGLLAICPPAAIIGGEALLVAAGLTRFASFGSIIGVVTAYVVMVPLTVVYHFPLAYLAYTLIGSITIVIMHKDNIARLVSGTERKIGEKARQVPSPETGT